MQTAGSLVHGAKAAIGATALRLTSTSTKLNNGLIIQALAGNGQTVYVGIAGVTTGTGLPLLAGVTSPLIPVSDPADVYVVAASGSNEVRFIGS